MLVSLLRDDEELVRKEAAWALSNVMAGTQAQLQAALDANVIPILVHLLQDVSVCSCMR